MAMNEQTQDPAPYHSPVETTAAHLAVRHDLCRVKVAVLQPRADEVTSRMVCTFKDTYGWVERHVRMCLD
jgi:hypothetical protein